MLDKLAANVEAQLRRLQKRKIFQDDSQSMGTSVTDEKPQNCKSSVQCAGVSIVRVLQNVVLNLFGSMGFDFT